MFVELCLLLGLLWLSYKAYTADYDYWKKRGFPYLEPKFPFGNVKDYSLFRRYQGYVHEELYKKGSPHPYVGIISIRRPALLVRDPEILKHIFVKDFSYFKDRLRVNRHDYLDDHLFMLGGDRWRALRVKLAPTFTTGKLKTMFALFQGCAGELDKLLGPKAARGEVVDVKDLMARFTTDIIGSCAFGLDTNSMVNPDNDFRNIGKLIFPPLPRLGLRVKFAILNLFPNLEKIFQFQFADKRVEDIMKNVVTTAVEQREKNEIHRKDFLDLLIQLKKKGKLEAPLSDLSELKVDNQDANAPTIEMTERLLICQCYVFFLAGFETSSSVMTYCMWELAMNQDIQDRLRQEIDEVTAKHGDLTYQAIQEMAYLDQVVSETIRKYPTLPFLNRTCVKKYRMPDSGLVLEEGTRVLIPAYALHHDPAYFPDPEVFDPDRFSPDRRDSIKPFTYLPFGEGPRLCIGMRFGQLQAKMGIVSVLKKYKLLRCSETEVPIKFAPSVLITTTKGPIKLLLKER